MTNQTKIRLGTRKSPLARWQAEWVASELEQLNVDVEFVYITTTGDTKLQPLGNIGGAGLFTKEIQNALLDNRIDLAVHSLKDLPTEAIDRLTLAAVPPRETTCDAFIGRTAKTIDELGENATVGTGSSRRRAQLLRVRGDLNVIDIRGNVDTRLAKLDDGQFDAIILAEAGLKRLGLDHRITELISQSDMLPAIGQGALGLEVRADDLESIQIIQQLDHFDSRAAVLAERAMLLTLQGGCLAPVAALARCDGPELTINARVLSLDGTQCLEGEGKGTADEAVEIGKQLADDLLSQGAADLIDSART